ncbi:MAG TPA: lipocalin family protein [Candidatus Nanoarchaeia archaeon]|nr:lipocalin family protein [Candidatus Nanoarchaeia archaeon]
MLSDKIIFPQDEQAHDKIIEWWYWNGHLQDAAGNRYGFMDCLFQAKPAKVKLPFLKMPFAKAYFSHSILSDIEKQKFYPTVDYVSLLSRDSFRQPLLFINYIDTNFLDGYLVSSMVEIAPLKYRLKARNFDLILTTRKKPLLVGDRGYLNLGKRGTYYYSLTNLRAAGIIKLGGKEIKVSGKAWMDHQWADAPYAHDKWNWFSLQFDDNTEMLCFEISRADKKTAVAEISYPNGKTEHLSEVIFTPTGKEWASPKTKAKYPLNWQIEIPAKKIKLQVKPLIKNQEMIFGTINYWEGPIAVSGKLGNKKANGRGFLELVGRPSQYKTYDFFKESASEMIKNLRKKLT